MKKCISLIILFVCVFKPWESFSQNSKPPYVPINGLVGWWPFNGNANDESGNGNNGTVNEAILTNDRFGNANKAYSFDGISDYIDCGNSNSVNILGDITISAWIYTNNFNIDHGIVSKSGLYDLVLSAPFTQPPLDKLRFEADSAPFLFSNPIQSNQWFHVVATYSSTNGKSIYLNGTLFAFDPQVGVFTSNNSFNLYLGSHQPFAVDYWSWDGKLDDIGIWNRALTEQEITNLYNSTIPCTEIIATSSPTNQTKPAGQQVKFGVAATGTNLSYQWQSDIGFGFQNLSNAGQYSGVNTDSLAISQLSLSNHNQLFRCIVNAGPTCKDTSSTAVLSIGNSTPTTPQVPQLMSYQAVLRDGQNKLLKNQNVGLLISIHQSEAAGPSVFSERHSTSTNANGLFSLEIGAGTAVSGSFATIDWSEGPYFVKTLADPTGGTEIKVHQDCLDPRGYKVHKEKMASMAQMGQTVNQRTKLRWKMDLVVQNRNGLPA